jgi:hypothetical protein
LSAPDVSIDLVSNDVRLFAQLPLEILGDRDTRTGLKRHISLLVALKTQSKILKYHNNFHLCHDRPVTKNFLANDKFLSNAAAGALLHDAV